MEAIKSRLSEFISGKKKRWTQRKVLDWKLRYDINQVQRFEYLLNKHGYSLKQFKSFLDFGCGVGRLMQHFKSIAPETQFYGCDPLQSSINISKKRFPEASFELSQWCPPLPYADEQFDFIFSYSVFTHLTEDNHKSWLKELSRILKKGGIMLHTTHSYESLKRIAIFSPWALEKYQFNNGINSFNKDTPYHYVVDNENTPEYGLTIINKNYVQSEWPRITGLSVMEYVEAAVESYPEGCQDAVLLRK